MEKKLLTVLTLIALGTPVYADMQGSSTAVSPTERRSSFERLDLDRDQLLSKQEVANVVTPSKEFGEADINADGKLNLAEYTDYIKETHTSAAMTQTSGMDFSSLDTDRNGSLSRSEYDAGSLAGSGHGSGNNQAGQEPDKVLVVPVPPDTDAVIVAPAGSNIGSP